MYIARSLINVQMDVHTIQRDCYISKKKHNTLVKIVVKPFITAFFWECLTHLK